MPNANIYTQKQSKYILILNMYKLLEMLWFNSMWSVNDDWRDVVDAGTIILLHKH